MKKWISLLLAGVLSVTMLAACGGKAPAAMSSGKIGDSGSSSAAPAEGELAKVLAAGELKIGYTLYAPMNYEGDDGKLTGFDTEFAELVCEKLGVTPKFELIVWESKNIELESGNIDAIWNGMTITEDLKNNFSISDPYAQNTQVIVTKAENQEAYADLANLADKTISLESGSAAQDVASKDEHLQNAVIIPVTTQTNALLEVKSGTADAAIFDQTMAQYMIGEGTDYDDLVIAGVFHKEEYGVAFRKNSNLAEHFNTIMRELIADGTLAALAEKYELTLA